MTGGAEPDRAVLPYHSSLFFYADVTQALLINIRLKSTPKTATSQALVPF